MRVKNCSKLSIVRSLPIHNSRVQSFSIWYTRVRYLCPFAYWISSTPIAWMGPRLRCSSPHSTTFYRLADVVPSAAERYGGFLPGQLAGPVGQKQYVGLGQLMFADRPWQFFNPHAAGSAIDPPHAVK